MMLGFTVSARAAAPVTFLDADWIASSADGRSHEGDLKRWVRDASLSEIMFVLRHPGIPEPRIEKLLVEEALKRVSRQRPDLLRRLRLRLAVADPRQARKMLGEIGSDPGPIVLRARASVFRVAVLLPAAGPYASYAEALRTGIECGLDWENAQGQVPLETRFWDTGNDDPARTAAVLDSASQESAVVIGELLSVPTLALATGARVMGLPLISPTATDENVGAAGTTVFQVGPSGFHRGVALARQVLKDGTPRVAELISSDQEERSFHTGFTHAIEEGGGQIVWHDTYAPGARDFRAAVKRLDIENVGLVFWDGDPQEGVALIREIQRQKLDVRVCGGEALSPANQHRSAASVLEHARFVADDWTLRPGLKAPLDSLLATHGVSEATALHVRGFLAARLIAAAVRGRALCAEEMTASLATRVHGDEYLVRRGFLDWDAEGASLPVYEVRGGEAVRLPEP